MIKIGLCGYGTVGSGVYQIINENKYFKEKVKITKILVHDINKERNIDKSLFTNNYKDIIDDKDINIVIECIGGTSLAYDIVSSALNNKKHVITANKALLEKYLDILSKSAQENNVSLLFEASVCASLPCISLINDISLYDEITSIDGIINGSTNYILTRSNDISFSEAIEEARIKGFLEADPTDDVCGFDALRKIIILSRIAYNANFNNNYNIRGITSLSENIFVYAKNNNMVIKYIASSVKENNTISISVLPTLIKKDNLFSNVNYEKNIIRLKTKYSNCQTLIGYGAGSLPTASAIINDLVKILSNKSYSFNFNNNLIAKPCNYDYIIESNSDLDIDYEAKIGTLYIVRNLSFEKLNEIAKSIISYARIY